MLIKSIKQEPYNGVRKTRWAVVRNSYRELEDTTKKSFFDWVDKSHGTSSVLNNMFTWTRELDDGTSIHAEFLFRALDKPSDVKKLLSLELTGIFLNECRELPKAILDMSMGRVGRYPAKRQGGPTWYGCIADTNPPDVDSWYYKLFEENLPENFAIFHQPSGMSDKAENIDNLPDNYYGNMLGGKTNDWIKVYVHGEYGFLSDNKPVYPEYNDGVHYLDEHVPNDSMIFIGIDFGLTPAAVFGQLTPSGKMVLIDELVTFDMGAVRFSQLLKEKIARYSRNDFEVYGDPAGEQRAQTDEVTPFMILSNNGINAFPTHTNDPTIRREAVADYLTRLDFNSEPAFALTSKCPMSRKAFNGGYAYKRLNVSGSDRYVDRPDKNKFSHVADACQYMFLGAVGSDRIIGGYGDSTIDYSSLNDSIV